MIQASKSFLVFAALVVPVLVALLVATATGTPAMPAPTPGAMPAGHDMAPAATGTAGSAAFTLRTGIDAGRPVYIGVGGAIDKVVNPTLAVPAGAAVAITLINGISAQIAAAVAAAQAAGATPAQIASLTSLGSSLDASSASLAAAVAANTPAPAQTA